MTSVPRVYNFSSGPAVLPLPVLVEIQRDLMALSGCGMSILAISHRSAAFEGIPARSAPDARTLAGVEAMEIDPRAKAMLADVYRHGRYMNGNGNGHHHPVVELEPAT